jgi:hypothetical protein
VRSFALVIFLCAASAGATTLLRWDTLELARRSQMVVQGRVLHIKSRWSSDGMRILTDVDIQVDSVWKGTAGSRVRVVQPGGVIEGLAQRVDGVAAFAPDEEVVVFLEPHSKDLYGLTGMALGKYRVDRTRGVRAIPEALQNVELVDPKTHQKMSVANGPLPLDQLRAQVEATVQATP